MTEDEPGLRGHLEDQLERPPTFWHRVRAGLVIENVPVDGNVRVVDVGAGTGWLAAVLAAQRPNARYAFIEPMPALRARLRSQHGSSADLADANTFEPDDIVIALDVLEHQTDDAAFVESLAQRMHGATRLMVTVPAFRFLWSAWDEALGHKRRYRRSEIVQVLSAHFEIEEAAYLFPELLPAMLVRKLMRPRHAATHFPRLPHRLDASMERVGTATMRARRWIPFGTSLFTKAVRR